MAAALVLLFFIILGLGTVLVAMRGGPHGMRETLETGRRRPLHLWEFAVAGAIVLFGLAVPAVVLMGDPAAAGPGGSKLSAEKKEGRMLFAQRCSQCHTLKDAGAVGKVGPSLDVLAPPKGLTVNAIKQGRAGKGQMPAQLLEAQDAEKVAAYIEEVAGR